MAKRPLLLLALPATLLLAACAGSGSTVISREDYHRYSRSDYLYGAGGRDLTVVVRGNPTGASDSAFEKAVIEGMQGSSPVPQTNFVLGTTERTRPEYRVALLFARASPTRADDLCGRLDTLVPQNGPGGETRVSAAFCHGGEALSEAKGRTAALAGPDDPRLASLMSQLALTLLPPENPHRREYNDGPRPRSWFMGM